MVGKHLSISSRFPYKNLSAHFFITSPEVPFFYFLLLYRGVHNLVVLQGTGKKIFLVEHHSSAFLHSFFLLMAPPDMRSIGKCLCLPQTSSEFLTQNAKLSKIIKIRRINADFLFPLRWLINLHKHWVVFSTLQAMTRSSYILSFNI